MVSNILKIAETISIEYTQIYNKFTLSEIDLATFCFGFIRIIRIIKLNYKYFQKLVDNGMGSKNNLVSVKNSDFEVFQALAKDNESVHGIDCKEYCQVSYNYLTNMQSNRNYIIQFYIFRKCLKINLGIKLRGLQFCHLICYKLF